MPTSFFDNFGIYYETITDIPLPAGHTVAPQKPSSDHQWIGGAWVYVAPTPAVPPEITKIKLFDYATHLEATDPANYTGFWAGIEAFIAADPIRQKRWELARSVATDDPLLDSLQAALGWTTEQRNAFLIGADTYVPA